MKRLRLLNGLNGLARFVPDLLSGEGKSSSFATTPEQTSVASAGLRILIIDDDEVMLAATSMRLTRAGCSVAVAKDGSEAIGAIGRQSPDFILLDLNFPPDVSNGGLVSWDGFRIMYWLRGLENVQSARFII
ncbi:MAG: response regulator, partial [Limisphaerales bacterium]